MNRILLLFAVFCGSILACPAETGPQLDPKDYPPPGKFPFDFYDRERGTVNLSITFGRNGEVAKCTVLKTSASPRLTAFTTDYVKKNWHSDRYAGRTVTVPIKYAGQKYDPHFSAPNYPEIAYWTHQVGDVALAITFDSHGDVDKCVVQNSTTARALVNYTTRFIESNWSRPEEAGKTMFVTVTYGRSAYLSVWSR